MLAELEELDKSRAWPRLFQRINWEASQKAGALTAARLPENRQLNRYRDVLPYDHSRIILKDGPPDYINANLVEVPRLNKNYILTQGPLPHTAKHFWQMIWEQNTAAVVMLNRVVEKNQIKCYQYWPCGQAYGHVDQLEFGNFRIHYLQELHNEYFTIRTLELENMLTGERRSIDHFHYLTWPDFGVPTSPATFLAFLFEVRKAGVLSPDVGPCVVHCSAGIGRSGTFVMVDSVLKEIECTGDMDQVSITDLLLEIRQYRVGLIQTPDQLRFTYLAILEGVRVLMPEIYQRAAIHHLQTNAERSDDQESAKQNSPAAAAQNNQEDSGEESPPPLPPRRRLEAAATADEPDTKRSRPSEHGMSQRRASTQKTDKHKNKSMMRRLFHLMPTERETKADSDYSEPEADKDVFSESSEGSDEIIDLSSLSDSEPEEDSVQNNEEDNSITEPSHLPVNEDVKKEIEASFVQAELQQVGEGDKLLQQTDRTEDDLQQTDKELQQGHEGVVQTDMGLQQADALLQRTDGGLQQGHEGLQQPDAGLQQTDAGLQQANTEGLQQTDGGATKETESATEVRRRRREERKEKITNLVENIKKNVKREEDAKVWKSRLKKTLIVITVCSVAYITFRYFTSG